jgi:hypothetical protein
MADEPAAFGSDEFYRTLSEVQGRLAELRYIDRATEYLESQQAQWWENEPIGSQATMEFQFGETVPFTRTYHIGTTVWIGLPWQETKEVEISRRLGEIAEEASTWATDSVAALTERVEPLTWATPEGYEGHVAVLEDVNWVLENLIRTDFDKLTYSIGHWEGEAAESYLTNFHEPFEDTRASHSRLIGALAGGLATAKAIVGATQHSLMNVVRRTSDLLYRQLELRSLDTAQESKATALIIGAGVASIAGVIAGPALWTVAWEAVAAGFSLASEGIPTKSAIEVELVGSTADQLLESLETALDNIEAGMVYQYDELEDQLRIALDRVELLRDGNDGEDGALVPISPSVVDGVDADTFRLPDTG